MKTKDACKIRPLGDHLVLEMLDPPSETPGGLVLPAGAKEKPSRGRVVAVGPGRPDYAAAVEVGQGATRYEPIAGVAVGDVVLVSTYSGTEVEFAGRAFRIVRECDLLGVIDP